VLAKMWNNVYILGVAVEVLESLQVHIEFGFIGSGCELQVDMFT
jgi:hypothetical protein